jgi:hypothetical protein
MIQNLFTCQPAYHQDLQKASETISEALEKCLQTIKDTMVVATTILLARLPFTKSNKFAIISGVYLYNFSGRKKALRCYHLCSW